MKEETFRTAIVIGLGLMLVLQLIVLMGGGNRRRGCGCGRRGCGCTENFGYRGGFSGGNGACGANADSASWN